MKKSKKIFRVPTYHPRFEITREVIREIAASYDPSLQIAPLKPGHQSQPGTPAFAWFKEIRAVDDYLEVVFDTDLVTKAGFAALKSGNFKTVSPEFYPPDSPYNPTPGKWYFKALAHLGAQSPAGKGLDTIDASDLEGFTPPETWKVAEALAFEEGERENESYLVFDQEPEKGKSKNNLDPGGQVKRLKEIVLAAIKGIVPDDKLAEFGEKIATEVSKGIDVASFSEEDKAVMVLVENLAKAQAVAFTEQGKSQKTEAELAAARKELAEFSEKSRRSVIEAKADSLSRSGKLPPKRKEEFVKLGMACPTDETTYVAFTEKDGKASKRSLFDSFCAFFEEFVPANQAVIDEVSKPEGKTADFSEQDKSIDDIVKRNSGGRNG